ncbi:MAG: hypothetical protein L6R42_003838 [Xanthoria sp. 1 TBL-2021]|nr:MAG: hypothetical protein L6R42_003838 [Xanthoria sp. 1 TBL-2021]
MDPSLSFKPSQPLRSCQYRPSHLRQANPRPTSAQLPQEDLWELIKDQLAPSSPIDVAGFLGTDRTRESIPRKEDFPEICRSVERSAGYEEGTQQDRIHRLFKFLALGEIASKTFGAIWDQSIERKANDRTSSSKTTAASSNTRGRSSGHREQSRSSPPVQENAPKANLDSRSSPLSNSRGLFRLLFV